MTDIEPSVLSAPAADIHPVVATPRGGLSGIAIVALAIVAGLLLFGMLEARRRGNSAPATTARVADSAGIAALPPLYVPPDILQAADIPPPGPVASTPLPFDPPPLDLPPSSSASGRPAVQGMPDVPTGAAYGPAPAPLPTPGRSASGQVLVLDNGGAGPATAPSAAQAGEITPSGGTRSTGMSTNRVRAAMLANRSVTVPQGTLIPAVLETAFDSTSPGFARALVQRDVRGFDGTQILIPRGSRLIGEYGEDVAQGQRRAIILWTRLIRPDGITIAIGSPAADPLGRGGVKADVDTHFLERFGGAFLQSTLDLGVGLAARSSGSPVLVALPGSIGNAGRSTTQPATIKPTLRVPAARSVSIFVARDLDFSGLDRGP